MQIYVYKYMKFRHKNRFKIQTLLIDKPASNSFLPLLSILLLTIAGGHKSLQRVLVIRSLVKMILLGTNTTFPKSIELTYLFPLISSSDNVAKGLLKFHSSYSFLALGIQKSIQQIHHLIWHWQNLCFHYQAQKTDMLLQLGFGKELQVYCHYT